MLQTETSTRLLQLIQIEMMNLGGSNLSLIKLISYTKLLSTTGFILTGIIMLITVQKVLQTFNRV